MINLFGGNAQTLSRYPRVYNKSDFGITADVTCQPSIYTKVGEVTVPAGQKITFGIGGVGNGVDTREVAYIKFADSSGNQLHGTIRLVLSDPNEVKKIVVAEQRTERFSASESDKTQGFLLGEYPIRAKEDSKLIVEFYPDSASAVTIDYDNANTKVLMPVTVYQ